MKLCRQTAIGLVLVFCTCTGIRAFAEDPGYAARETAAYLPRPDHVVIVVEENKSYAQIIGNRDAPYINKLAGNGALFTRSFAVTHPSQPNYLALFSGSTHGITSNACPLQLSGDNLASELIRKDLSFDIYSESLPATGYEGCFAEKNYYARKHNPAVNWQGRNVTAAVNRPFTEFPREYDKLPTVSMVIPNQVNDMHSAGSLAEAIVQGDLWLQNHLDAYAQWAMTHNSLLIITWDEDDGSSDNHITTVFFGPMVKPGRYDYRIDHYTVLRTLAEMYGLSPPGMAANARPLQDIWVKGKVPGAH